MGVYESSEGSLHRGLERIEGILALKFTYRFNPSICGQMSFWISLKRNSRQSASCHSYFKLSRFQGPVNGYMLFSNRAMGVSMTKVIHHLTKRLASKKRDTANHSGKVRTHQVQSSSHQHRKPSQMTCHDPNNPFS
jgi:hypothetical protein